MPVMFELFIVFLKVGLFTIGGGYAMIPLIQQEIVSRQWCTLPELLDYMAVAQSTPGAFAVNTATFVGMRVGGIPGALITNLGLVLPSFVILLVIAMFFKGFKDSFFIRGIMSGLHPAVIGLMLTTVATVTLSALGVVIDLHQPLAQWFGAFNIVTLIVLVVVVVLWLTTKLHPIVLILISGACGIVLNYGRDLIVSWIR